MYLYGRLRIMGIGYRPTIYLTVRGIIKPVNTRPVSANDLPVSYKSRFSIMDGVKRSLLGFDYLEVEADVLGKKEIIELKEMQYLEKFKKSGKREFLREMNEIAFLDLCDKINKFKENIVTVSGLESKNHGENIDLQIKTIQNYEKFKLNFVDWFTSNHFNLPIIPGQKQSVKNVFKDIMRQSFEEPIVPIEKFNTLEMSASEYLEPNEKVHIRLTGDDIETRYIKISKMQGAFLMFLMMERQEGGHMWLLKPEQHVDKLRQIKDYLDLPIKYDTAIQGQIESEITWFNDPINKYRKSIVSKINKNLELNGPLKGNLIILISKASPSRKGIYTLLPTIENIETNFLSE